MSVTKKKFRTLLSGGGCFLQALVIAILLDIDAEMRDMEKKLEEVKKHEQGK